MTEKERLETKIKANEELLVKIEEKLANLQKQKDLTVEKLENQRFALRHLKEERQN